MGRALRFFALLLVALAALTWFAFSFAVRTTSAWFERDLRLRSTLAVAGARQSIVDAWQHGDEDALSAVLHDIARDERVLSVYACNQAGQGVVFVGQDTARDLACPVTSAALAASAEAHALVEPRPGGPVHVTVVPIAESGTALGTVALVHDLSFVERRRQTIRGFVLGAFAVLAVCASLLTLAVVRLSWRGWTREVRAMLLGSAARPEFAPVVRDVRELARRMADEALADAEARPWDPERLRETLHRHLHGERVIVVANREPYIHDRQPDGLVVVKHPASGLVTALEPVMRACSGVWVAHGSGSADRETADASGRLAVPPGEACYTLRRVWLTTEQERGYYYGLSNEGLWPLCHLAHTRPVFRASDWMHYHEVNSTFADVVRAEAGQDDPIVFVQDYHFGLAPRLLRERLPRATILTFWHIPWPNAERVGICPFKADLLRGLLGSSILGFHTQLHCNNFLDSVDRYLEARIDREQFAVHLDGHVTLVRPYPISIEWPSRWAASTPPVAECRRAVRERLGLAPDAWLGVGVDRLDYTKGIEERLQAVERLFDRHPELVGRLVFVQLAAPTRSAIDDYRNAGERVVALSRAINQRLARGSWQPIVLEHAHHEPDEVFRHYRAADFCYVSSLHDGMNLVAKEFVAARDDAQGVLLVSTFAGAARELTEALVVNPYDLDEAAEAMAAAVSMPPGEQRDRMSAMRAHLSEFNVYRWAGRMLTDAARIRRREQLRGRWAGRHVAPARTATRWG